MQAHSTMRGKRPKIIDVDLLSDVSSPKCHSPKSPRIKEEELDDIEEMQVEAQVEEDVMGLSDAESDEVEEEEEASKRAKNTCLSIPNGPGSLLEKRVFDPFLVPKWPIFKAF